MADNEPTQYKPLHITKTFDAPRSLVWEAWTKPEHFAQWYAPDQFSIPVCELDVRTGGQIRVDMKGPDGTIYPSTGTFVTLVEPERLVMTNTPLDSEGNVLFEVRHSLTLSEHDGQTVLDLISEVVSAGPKAAPYLAGMETGLQQALAKLAAHVEAKS